MSAAIGDTTTTRPTFDSLDWSEPAQSEAASPTADTVAADEPSSSPSPAGATDQPKDTPAETEQPRETRGPIPFDRHEAILKSEREKREELEGKWQRVQWASELSEQGATAEQIRTAYSAMRLADSDPVRFVEHILTNASAHPELAHHVRSIAARVLGQGRSNGQPAPDGTGQSAADAEAEPQPDLYQPNEDGSRTLVYSAPRLKQWQEWNQRQIESRINARLAPIEQERQNAEAQRRYDEMYRNYQDEGRQLLDVFKERPYFAELKAGVKTFLDEKGYSQQNLSLGILHVLNTKILPSLGQTERANAIADMRTQAAASSLSPKAAAASAPARPKSFDDPSLKW